MGKREEFPKAVQETIAKRVGVRCSNPGCRQLTAGPREEPTRSVNIGVAAHITAASPTGPRYDPGLPTAERRSVANAIWLCQNCAKLIDNDPQRYCVELLQSWKTETEGTARAELEGMTAARDGRYRADVIINGRPLDKRRERHDYSLDVVIHNVGDSALREYHIDVEMPRAVLMDLSGAVSDRSNENTTLFRIVWRGADQDIFPGDRRLVKTIRYFMDSNLYRNRKNLLDLPVRATLYCGGHRLVRVEHRFGELQCF